MAIGYFRAIAARGLRPMKKGRPLRVEQPPFLDSRTVALDHDRFRLDQPET
jgi:hypothetical protein